MKDSVKLWGLAYQIGSHAYDNDPKAKKEIDDLNVAIYKMVDENKWRKRLNPHITIKRWNTRERNPWDTYYYKWQSTIDHNFGRCFYGSLFYVTVRALLYLAKYSITDLPKHLWKTILKKD